VLGFAKAKICIMDGPRKGKEIEVLFNPSEYSLEGANNFRDTNTPGLDKPITQFLNGLAGSLTMELYFDTYTDGGGSNVTEKTDEIAMLLGIEEHAPPKVEFRWGGVTFCGVVEKVSQRFTMFLPDGVPVRAKLNVTFKGIKALAEQLRDPRRNSSDKTKRRVLTADSSIWLVAAREYGDPRYWRLIARQNGVDDPAAIRPGTPLIVPPLDAKLPGGAP
jgi:nucleoid-associated protein YgaU